MIESDFTSRVHKKLSPDVLAWKIRDDFQGGVPDAYYMHLNPDNENPQPMFIEYKYLKKLPVRDTTLIIPNLSPLQVKWLQNIQSSKSAKPFVILGAGMGNTSKGVLLTLDQALDGITCGDFKKACMSYADLAKTIETELLYG